MATRLNHLGLAVPAHDDVIAFWRDLLGLPVELTEHVASEGVRVAMLRLGPGSGCIELLEPDAADTVIGRYLDKRGPGIHHVALTVDDLPGTMASMKDAGVRLLDEAPRPGAHDTRVAFVHPKSTGGVLVELVQAKDGE